MFPLTIPVPAGRTEARRWTLAILGVVALETAVSAPAHGQISGTRLSFSTYFGGSFWGEAIGLRNGGLFGVRGGFYLGRFAGIEGSYGIVLTEELAAPNPDVRVNHYAADLVVEPWPRWRFSPYVLGGWAQLEFDPGAGETQSFDGWGFGGGLNFRVSSPLLVSLDIRDTFIKTDPPYPEVGYVHNVLASVGLKVAVGRHDRQRVQDVATKSTTPAVAQVTPAVPAVKPSDPDSDADGVPDNADRCANTPPRIRVDEHGCPLYEGDIEAQLLISGSTYLPNLHFGHGEWTLEPESFRVLDELGRILLKWPQLHIEIAGHTDSEGSEAYNLRLSERRAQAVSNYLRQRFPEIEPRRYLAVAYGERRSLASNETSLGRADNRRVEIVLINHEVIGKPARTP